MGFFRALAETKMNSSNRNGSLKSIKIDIILILIIAHVKPSTGGESARIKSRDHMTRRQYEINPDQSLLSIIKSYLVRKQYQHLTFV